jgi:hypothetical protein
MEFVKINNFELYVCNKCGHMKKKNILPDNLQKIRYDNHICDDGYLKYMKSVYKKISNHLILGDSLDYGCGQIHALSDILNTNNIKCDYYDLFYYNKLENKKYDNIILIEVIEHVEDVLSEIMKIKDMLKARGKIIIMTNFIPQNISNWWYLRDSTHVSFLNKNSIIELAKIVDMDVFIEENNNLFVLSMKA